MLSVPSFFNIGLYMDRGGKSDNAKWVAQYSTLRVRLGNLKVRGGMAQDFSFFS